jgi:hypothetical protein
LILARADRRANVHIDAQDLAEKAGGILAVIVRIVCRAAVAEGNVQITVRPEADLASIVVPVGLRNLEKDPLRIEVRPVRVGAGDLELADHAALRVLLAVEEVEEPVPAELRMKGESQQSLFVLLIIVERPASGDVQELLWSAAIRTSADEEDLPSLLDDEEPSRAIRRLAHPDRAIQSQCGKGVPQRNGRQRG